MFESVRDGWDLIFASFRVFGKYPLFIVPLFIVWIIYATIIIYFKFFFNWDNLSINMSILVVFLIIFCFTLLISFSCLVVLELIQQIETGNNLNLLTAFSETIKKDFIKIIPLALIWAVIWFILTIVEAILRKKKKSDTENDFTARNVASTLSGEDEFSWSGFSIDLLQKGIRMIIFLILPAIAWEDMGFFKSIKRGFSVLRKNIMTFATGFTLTYLAAVIVFFPPAILLYVTGELEIALPDIVWFFVIIYIGIAWSYSLYLEQMFAAHLYLWHLRWEKKCESAIAAGKDPPRITAVNPPSILDEVPDLIKK